MHPSETVKQFEQYCREHPDEPVLQETLTLVSVLVERIQKELDSIETHDTIIFKMVRATEDPYKQAELGVALNMNGLVRYILLGLILDLHTEK